MKNNIDMDDSFNPEEISIEKVLREPNTALFHFEGNVPAKYKCLVRSFYIKICLHKYHCIICINIFLKLKSVWKSTSPVTYGSFAVKKNSYFTEYFNNVLEELKETGQLDILEKRYDRHTASAKCNTLSMKIPALGFEKLTFLFAILIIGSVVSVFIFLFEFKMQSKARKLEIGNHSESEEMEELENLTRKLLEGSLKEKTGKILKILLEE